MARNGDGLHRQTAEVEGLALPEELEAVRREAVGKAGEVRLGQGETHAGHLHHRGKHAGVVAMAMGEGHGHGLFAHALRNEGPERLGGVVGPVDGVGEVDDEGLLLADDQIDVRAVVEMGQLAVRVEFFARGIGAVVVLDVIDVLFDDGHGVGADFDVLGAASRQGEGQEKKGGKLFHNGLYSKSISSAPPARR